MSSAVLGRWSAKKSGVKTRTPCWLASARGACVVGPVGTGVWAAEGLGGAGAVCAKAPPALNRMAVVARRMDLVIALGFPSFGKGGVPGGFVTDQLQDGQVD